MPQNTSDQNPSTPSDTDSEAKSRPIKDDAKRANANARAKSGSPARRAALFMIIAVLEKKRSLDDVWAEEILSGQLKTMDTRDRAFVRALTASCLRHLGELDHAIDKCIDKPLPSQADHARHIMRLGLTELDYLRTPDHAAVSAAVDLAQSNRNARPFKPLVNAILRRLVRERNEREAFPPEKNLPKWLWESWKAAYGEETARAIAQVQLGEPPLDLSVKSNPEAWAEKLGGTLLPTGTVRLATSHVEELEGYADGEWWVQDISASLPAKLLGNLEGKKVLDLCAAPGGKTAQLAAMGATVTALDRSAPRLSRLKQNLARLNLSHHTKRVTADATAWTPNEPFDAVLLDAPCTATGTARRHPDMIHLKSQEDVTRIANLQRRMLTRAINWITPDGTLIYCVCSLQPEEGEAQIDRLMSIRKDIVRDPITADEVGNMENLITDKGDLRVLPAYLADQGGMDGFFIARLKRKPKPTPNQSEDTSSSEGNN